MSITRREVMENIEVNERKNKFDVHVDPIDYNLCLPIDNCYPYKKLKFWDKLRIFFHNIFIIQPYILYVNKIKFKLKVKGRKNLKGIKSAIVTCNHVNKLDCLAAQYALRGHKTLVTGATFNNMKGFFGDMMRSGGFIPIGNDLKSAKVFNSCVEELLNKNRYVMFYPEQAMWWNYEKPRPLKNGAFHFAHKFNVPIIPLFITFKDRKKTDSEGIPYKTLTLNIMPAIYPNHDSNKIEDLERLKRLNYEVCVKTYEEFYNKKMEYLSDTKVTLENMVKVNL